MGSDRCGQFTLNNKNHLCIAGYHSKFLIVKKTEDMSADSLILSCKVIFSEFGLPKKIMSDWGGNFTLDKFKWFCKKMIIEQATSLSYHQQNNGQVEACIKFIKHTMKKCIEINNDIHVALLQIKSTPLEPGLPSPASLLFNHPIWSIMTIINRLPIKSDNDDEHYEAFINRQAKNDRKYDTARNYDLFSIGSTVAVQQEDGGPCTHGTVVGRGNHKHNNKSYTIRVTKTGCIIARNSKHIKTTPTTAEQYLRDQLTQHMEHPVDKKLR